MKFRPLRLGLQLALVSVPYLALNVFQYHTERGAYDDFVPEAQARMLIGNEMNAFEIAVLPGAYLAREEILDSCVDKGVNLELVKNDLERVKLEKFDTDNIESYAFQDR